VLGQTPVPRSEGLATRHAAGFNRTWERSGAAHRRVRHPPVIAIFIGAVLSYSGRYDLEVRASCLIVLFLWISIDSGKTFWKWRKDRKGVVIIVLMTTCFALLFGGSIYFIRATKIHDQQEEVTRGLTVIIDHQAASDDPFSTTFNIANNSPIEIVRSTVSCIPRIKFAKGVIWPGNGLIDGYATYNSPLGSGDEETYLCNPKTAWGMTMECADMTITISYWTAIHPEVELQKSVRYLTRQEQDGIHFYRESASNPTNFCFPHD
jgi:hypothetical protein